jgi:hypothetical protein
MSRNRLDDGTSAKGVAGAASEADAVVDSPRIAVDGAVGARSDPSSDRRVASAARCGFGRGPRPDM